MLLDTLCRYFSPSHFCVIQVCKQDQRYQLCGRCIVFRCWWRQFIDSVTRSLCNNLYMLCTFQPLLGNCLA